MLGIYALCYWASLNPGGLMLMAILCRFTMNHPHLVPAGTLLNMLGLILIGCSRPGKVNALIPGAVILGLGGITYHLGNFHISNLFPRKRGLISSLFVAGFTGCGIIFYILNEIYKDLGGSW